MTEEFLKDHSRPAPPVPLDYLEELEKIWGRKWGAQSEIGKLEETLVQRPGEEIAPPPDDLLWHGVRQPIDAGRAGEQHDALVDALKSEGVKVHYVGAPPNVMGPYDLHHRIWATRDPGIVVRGGAIIGRMSLPYRKGDEIYWTRKTAELGCPILYTVHGKGLFEGGNVVWLDDKHVCIGRSIRTNQDGIDQVAYILRRVGVEEIRVVPIPGWLNNLQWPAGGWAHIDCVFAYVDVALAMVYPPGLPYDFIEYLREKRIRLIEVPPEGGRDFVCNVVAIEPGKIIMLAGFDSTRKTLEKEGVDAIEVDMSQIVLSGGGPHCATAPIVRQEGPALEY